MTAELTCRDRVEGCWAGKCLAGAIGMPYEGVPHSPHLRPEQIHVQDVPNDDLELQLVWLLAMERHGLSLRARDLIRPWIDDIQFGCDEYSIALRNLRHGVMPPESGCADNPFVDGMGAAIRSEIWAALFPGRPDAAAFFASQDATVDHWGDGVWAEVLLASAESRMFAGVDMVSALRQSLDDVPPATRLRKTLEEVFALRDLALDAETAKARLVPKVHHHNFTDCVMNLAYIVYALLWGDGDFIRTVLLAVNCGRDTDCTAATVGAILGTVHGTRAIPKELFQKLSPTLTFSEQIGRIAGMPQSLAELTGRTLALRERLAPELPAEPYPAYQPCPHVPPAGHDRAQWLLLDAPEPEIAAIREELLRTGSCPERLKHQVVVSEGLTLDLSAYARDAGMLNLFSFLHVENSDIPPDEVVVSATADVGMTMWLDHARLLNHHSRHLSIPSFHRAEGGAAFLHPLKQGDRKLVHIKLYSCLPPLTCTLMFGNLRNDPLDGFKLKI
ncbi:MAG: ADP-ribosylglycohydrolase family protein [Kiritimatiellia bacterium]|jgi:ADP-ribosylglycohydrolase